MTAHRNLTEAQIERITELCSLKGLKGYEPHTYRQGNDLIMTFTVKGFFDLNYRHTFVVKGDGKVEKKRPKILKEGK